MFKNIFYDWLGYNKYFFLFINKIFSGENTQLLLKSVSFLFNISHFTIYYFFAIFLIFYSWKKTRYNKPFFYNNYNHLVKVGLCYAIIGCSYALLKFTVNIPRPFCTESADLYKTLIDISKERCLSGFPSAHTAIALLSVYSLWEYVGKFWKLVLVLLLFFVMIGRVALAMHYPADIIYSIFITTCLILFSNLLFNLFKDNIIKYFGDLFYNKFRELRIRANNAKY